MRIAIPCNFPGGLNAKVSNHFGDCDVFTIVEINPKNPIFINLKPILIKNRDHLNCGILILRLKNIGTDVIIVHKIGERPLKIIQKENIPIYAGNGIVLRVIQDFCEQRLPELSESNICPGKNCNIP